MAEQEYCEVKVDLRLRYPDTDEKIRTLPQLALIAQKIERGSAFHAAMSESAYAIHADDIARLVASGRPFTLVETLLDGSYERLRIVGRPDAIHVAANGRTWLVEFKVRDHAYPTPSDDAQLRLYGYLLSRDRRFRLRDLTLVCAFVSAETG